MKDDSGNKTDNINPNFDYWYHDPNIESPEEWKNGELYHLLTSLKVLNIKAFVLLFRQ